MSTGLFDNALGLRVAAYASITCIRTGKAAMVPYDCEDVTARPVQRTKMSHSAQLSNRIFLQHYF